MIATTTVRSAFELSISERGEMRSDMAPPTSMNSARGMAVVIRTVPSATPDPVSCSVSQAIATKWNWSPSREMLSPLNTNRKSRSRRGWISAKRVRAVGSGGAVLGVSISETAMLSRVTTSLHADEDAIAVLVLDIQDGSAGSGRDCCSDPAPLLVGETRNHAQRGVGEGQGDLQVHDLPPALLDPNPQPARVIARDRRRRLR